MTGYEIKKQAEQYIDEPIDDLEALAAINRAMGLLGDMLLVYDDAQMVVSGGEERTWKPLPSGATYVREVRTDAGRLYKDWRSRDGFIWFGDPGTYEVLYRRLADNLTNINNTPEVHPAWHPVLVTYLIGWWKLKDDDESPDGLRHMQQFEQDSVRVFRALSRGRGPAEMRVIRRG